MIQKSKLFSIKWQIAFIIFLIFAVISSICLVLTYRYVLHVLEDSLIEKGRYAGLNIAEIAAEKLIDNDLVGLRTYIDKARLNLNVEYILIEDFNNEIKTDTYNGMIPKAILNLPAVTDMKMVDYRKNAVVTYVDSLQLYDITQPIEEGLLGFVRVGIEQSQISGKTKMLFIFLVGVFLIGTFLAITLAIFIITLYFSKPMVYLTEAAHRISMGEFNTPVHSDSKNEIGALSESIERMRESLKTAIERLRGKTLS